MYKIKDLFDLSHTVAKEFLEEYDMPWEALPHIKDAIISIGTSWDKNEYEEVSPQVWIHKTATVMPSAYIGAPCVIGEGTSVRHCAFVRGSALIGKNCVIGNSVEIKNAIIFDNAEIPHYNYVGDSILGYKAHLGAGSITSNIRSDRKNVTVHCGEEHILTDFRKIGAMVGDLAEVGSNTVLNPGTVIGRNAIVYPLSCVRGTVPADCIYKTGGVIVKKI